MVADISINGIISLRKRVKASKERTYCLFEDHCDAGLFSMKFHSSDRLRVDLDKFGNVRLLEASVYEHFDLVLKRVPGRTSTRRVGGIEETCCALQSIFNGLEGKERNGVSAFEAYVTSRSIEHLGEAGCVLPMDGWELKLKELFGTI